MHDHEDEPHQGHPHHGHYHHGHHRHGHNAERTAAQWQTPHVPRDNHTHNDEPDASDDHRDMDLVEAAFYEGFLTAPDPTSFLRLAGIPFRATASDGSTIQLLRVEQLRQIDVGLLTPNLGGGSSYAPLPAKLTSKRQSLSFVYAGGSETHRLSFIEARALTAAQRHPTER